MIGGGVIEFLPDSGSYQSNMACAWDITCDVPGTVATITFDYFSTESGWDYVGIDHIPMTACSDDADTCYSGDGPYEPISNGSPDMRVIFESDGSVEMEGFLATVTCGPNSGRRRQQEQPLTPVNGTRWNSRDLIAESNVDAFKYDSDACIATASASSSDAAACAEIMAGWGAVADTESA